MFAAFTIAFRPFTPICATPKTTLVPMPVHIHTRCPYPNRRIRTTANNATLEFTLFVIPTPQSEQFVTGWGAQARIDRTNVAQKLTQSGLEILGTNNDKIKCVTICWQACCGLRQTNKNTDNSCRRSHANISNYSGSFF